MKYPNYIYNNVRQNMGLEWNDTSKDNEIDKMSRKEVLERFWTWEGIIGYANTIKNSVFDVYGINKEGEN